jgi:hypothetical protein
MRKPIKVIVLYILTIICLVSCSYRKVPVEASSQPSTPPPRNVIQEEVIKPLQRAAQFVNKKLEGSTIKSLPNKEIPPNAEEIRIWVSLPYNDLHGVILSQANGEWAASYIPILGIGAKATTISPLKPPQDGWSAFWDKLEALEFYTLPDGEDVGANSPGFDVESAFIEIKKGSQYRAYVYIGYTRSEKLEAKKLTKIIATLSEQFDLKLAAR